MQWLRNSFIAGFIVTVPLVISVAAIVWIFQVLDGLTGPMFARWLGRDVPGLGLVTTLLTILLVGVVATNVIGRRLVQQAEAYLVRVPVFRSIYSPVKQLLVAFSPDNEYGFKRVALVSDAHGGVTLGFVTRHLTIDEGDGPQSFFAVYVPTNHLYLGDVVVAPEARVSFPDITVEQGIRIFLTGGMSLPPRIRARPAVDRIREFRA